MVERSPDSPRARRQIQVHRLRFGNVHITLRLDQRDPVGSARSALADLALIGEGVQHVLTRAQAGT